jgi:hypothetical protein
MSPSVDRQIGLHPVVEAFSNPISGTAAAGTPSTSPERPKIMDKLNLITLAFNLPAQPEEKRRALEEMQKGNPGTAYDALRKFVERGSGG